MRLCEQCGASFTQTDSSKGRFCCRPCWYAWRSAQPRKVTPKSVRLLQPGEPVPSGKPGRYKNIHGYIVLRWRVGRSQYVECLEHRLQCGLPVNQHVHHKNHQKDDNRPENL